MDVRAVAEGARAAARELAKLPGERKNAALCAMADGLVAAERAILEANAKDLEAARAAAAPAAEAAREEGYTAAFLDRLTLNPKRVAGMAAGLRQIAGLPDPVGEVTGMWRRPNGLTVGRMRVPLGVIGIIYESRPGVTADTAGLCLKSGNAVILRGGREALGSNAAIARVLREAAAGAGIPEGWLGFVDDPDRARVKELLSLHDIIDLIIPRGGPDLVRTVRETSQIPVIAHDKGLCHTYVDASADPAVAESIAFNAKVERPGVCNAMETLLVHEAVAPRFLPGMAARLRAAGVEVRGCPATRRLVPEAAEAAEAGADAEYPDLVLPVRVVASFEEAVAHIARHGSGLAEAIVTRDHACAMRFLREVDAGAVFVNASTRFTDGGEFGMGAEMGISTQKLHARGPMGLAELTCQKFIVFGDGHVRASAS